MLKPGRNHPIEGRYNKRRQVKNPRTPQVDLATKWAIDAWLEHLHTSAAKTFDRLSRTRLYKTDRNVRRHAKYWDHAAKALHWARRVNQQRRATDE